MRKLCLVILSAVLVGCVSVKPPAPVSLGTKIPFAERKQALQQIHHWDIQGAIGLQHNKAAESANYHWQQNGTSYHIDLAGALNVGATSIVGDVDSVTVSKASGEQWQGSSPNALIAVHTGWQLPIQQLHYWVRGIPAPGSYTHLQTDALGHLKSLEQLGWTIHWSRYTPLHGVDLPRWIVLQRPGWKVKLLVRDWSFS